MIFDLFFLCSGLRSISGLPLKRLAASLRGVVESYRCIVGGVIDLLHGRVCFLVVFAYTCNLSKHQSLRLFAQSASFCLWLLSFLFDLNVFVSRLKLFFYANIRNG